MTANAVSCRIVSLLFFTFISDHSLLVVTRFVLRPHVHDLLSIFSGGMFGILTGPMPRHFRRYSNVKVKPLRDQLKPHTGDKLPPFKREQTI